MVEHLLRPLAPTFVIASPSGARIRTRLHVTSSEDTSLTAIGSELGRQYRTTLTSRMRAGRLTPEGKKDWRREHKKTLTATTSSRWAGALTRAVEDQYQLAMRALVDEVAMLRAATSTIRRRLDVGVGERVGKVSGYRTAAEAHAKARRLEHLTTRLTAAGASLDAARPAVVVGGGQLWSVRENLMEAHLTVEQWQEKWNSTRAFFTADGETGKKHGNETIRVTPDGTVTVKVPAALVSEFGSHFTLSVPVGFSHRGAEWADRVNAHRAVRYDITFDPSRRRWYLDASWAYKDVPVPPLAALQAGRVLAVDLNEHHLAAHVLDSAGNPTGAPLTIALVVAGLPASTRSARVREAISELLRLAKAHGCAAVAIENLNFADARATGRETMGRGARGKRFRRTVAGIPTAQFRDRLVGMAATAGVHMIAVDPAYTSKWGAQHWATAVQASDPDATRHHAASVAIGRRALGHRIRRKKVTGPARGQRTTRSTPSSSRTRPHGTSGTGARTPGGRSAKSRPGHLDPGRVLAPKTVRGAPVGRDSLPLTD